VLCLIGGMDRGLRVGGRCCSKLTLKHGTLLGVLKEGSTSAKVLWDDSDAIIRSLVMEFRTSLSLVCGNSAYIFKDFCHSLLLRSGQLRSGQVKDFCHSLLCRSGQLRSGQVLSSEAGSLT